MIADLIFEWAEKTPDRTVVIFNGRHFSYRSFAHLIAVARGYFARHGCIGAGSAVVAVRNLIDFWVLSLALRSLGLTTVAAPSAKTVDALGLPDLRCVVTNPREAWPGLEGVCEALGLRLLSVSLAGEAPLDLGAAAARHPAGGHILLTSGTTAAQKMVLMSPEIDAVFLRRKAEIIGMNQDTVLSVFHFPAWTGAGYRWAASPWIVGGASLIEQRRGPHHALIRPGITHSVMVPSMLAAVLSAPADAFPRSETMQLFVGGGAMTRNEVAQAKARITPHVFNWLASTEAGGIALTPLNVPEDHRWHRLAPGRVVEIVDESDRLAPAGVTGLVRIGAEGGPNSYLHDENTTRAFFKHGYFYPGDLAVIRSDGRMSLQGRVTDVINIAGHKIPPGPIEDRLGEIFGVRAVCLFSKQDEAGEEEIHIVVETDKPINSERMIAAVRQELAGFSRATVHYLAALPRNEMGKVIRRAVRQALPD
jgi:acyl-coenzyme A synthetase/AMP-(fatty) acid ligase